MEAIIASSKISRLMIKVVIVNAINFIVFLSILFLLPELSKKANEVKIANGSLIAASRSIDSSVLKAQLSKEKENISKLKSFFDRDNTVISFVQNMDTIKQNGIVTNFDFPVSIPVPDRYGGTGFPTQIILKGNSSQISEALIEISKFPVLLRPITLTLDLNVDGTYDSKYGCFLYIN